MNGLSSFLTVAVFASTPVWSFQPDPAPAPDVRAAIAGKTGGSYLGVGVADISSERARQLNLGEERGVEITRVEDESPAGKGGLRSGDVVLEYNGQRVEGVEQFMRMVRETPSGREVKLSITRGGSAQSVTVRTGTRKTALARAGDNVFVMPRIEGGEIRIPDMPRAFMSWRNTVLGMEAESLDTQLASFFGVKEGVLVRSVEKGSAAEKAGLRAGDVITRVDGTAVSTPREVTTAVRAARAKKAVTLTTVREKREITLNVAIEERESQPFFSGAQRISIVR